MLSVNSYQPDKKVTGAKSRGFLNTSKKNKKTTKTTKKFDIKNDPRVLIRGILYTATSVILVACICISVYNIIRWKAENDISDQQITELQAETIITEVEVEPEPEPEPTPTKEKITAPITKSDPYWELVKIPLIDADLTNSLAKNRETAGWIQVPNTKINYPFVHTTDNEYYLNHSFNRTWNSAGWVFLDANNNTDLSDQNQIIYAHGRMDGSMFGSLNAVLTKEWQENINNHVVKISTLSNNSLWQVFSVYRIPVTSDYITINFENDSEFDSFLQKISARSVYDFGTTVHSSDKIITLSTCIGTNERVVLHAKLIKIAKK